MKKHIRYSLAALIGITGAFAAESSVHAYDWKTHGRMSEVSVQMMQDAATSSPSLDLSAPADVDASRWGVFINKLKAAEAQLKLLRTGLPTSLPRFISEDTSPFPYKNGTRLPCKVPDVCSPATGCTPTLKLDLGHPDALRIKQFADNNQLVPYETADPCGIDQSHVNYKSSLGEILAWHSGIPDDDIGDSQFWVKPTNAAGIGFINSVGNTIWRDGLGAALLPVVCVWEALFGDGCNIDDSFNAADQANPIQYIEGVIPGVEVARSTDYTGLWHFIDIPSSGQHNSPRGMLYENAGPDGAPGAVDIAIMGFTDLVGVSVEAGESQGVAKYGHYDEGHRSNPMWQATTIGHVEFSPLNHLAQYGWDKFNNGGAESAEGLAWPLHAIGDAVEPQHVAGTTSWGHRPLEDYTDQRIDSLLPISNLSATDRSNRREVLIAAFHYWEALEDGKDINHYIIDIAQETKPIAQAHSLELYKDAASIQYAAKVLGLREASIASYTGSDATLMIFMKKGTAATLGFLMFASEKIVDPGDAPEGFCPPDQVYIPGLSCSAPLSIPPPVNFPLDVCPANTSCSIDTEAGCPSGQVQHPTPSGGTVCCVSDVIVCGGTCCSPGDHSCDASGCSTFDPPR